MQVYRWFKFRGIPFDVLSSCLSHGRRTQKLPSVASVTVSLCAEITFSKNSDSQRVFISLSLRERCRVYEAERVLPSQSLSRQLSQRASLAWYSFSAQFCNLRWMVSLSMKDLHFASIGDCSAVVFAISQKHLSGSRLHHENAFAHRSNGTFATLFVLFCSHKKEPLA